MHDFLKKLGIVDVNPGASTGTWRDTKGPELVSANPADGKPIAKVRQATADDYEAVASQTHEAFLAWRMVPAPRRGEVIRRLGEELRREKDALGRLVSLENGKILSEGMGEVQEMIDICDFAVGLSASSTG